MDSTRRCVLLGGVTSILTLATGAQNTPGETFPPVPRGMEPYGDDPDYFSLTLEFDKLGTAEPNEDEKRIGREVINNAPNNTEPYKVAEYFRDIGLGKYGKEWQPYVRGWPVKYNPVIVEFFRGTRLNPLSPDNDGDQTAWCAAFVNWTIARAASKDGVITEKELRLGTQSASSGSFRCWNQVTNTPARGDIIVWAEAGTEQPCAPGKLIVGAGHVAYYYGRSNSKQLLVIGGNQRVGNAGQHAVTESSIDQSFTRVKAGQTVPVSFVSARKVRI